MQVANTATGSLAQGKSWGYLLTLHAVAAAHVLPWLLSPPFGAVRTWHGHSCPPVLAMSKTTINDVVCEMMGSNHILSLLQL